MTKDDTKTATPGSDGTDGNSFAFQAEVSRLLQLMVHSVYSERDIFLRELISNAADACDKLRYAAITKPDLLGDDPTLRITLSVDEEAGTLCVADNGIGMSRSELIENLGTIARSGTRAFLESASETGGAPSLIGQFGVGFYASFIVADRVDVISRAAGAKQAHVWRSDGVSGFDVAEATKEQEALVERGTMVILHLKEDARDFLKEGELTRAVRAYSDHIPFQIDFLTEREGKEERRQLNSANALWMRPKTDITPAHYKEFYHHAAGLYDEPALTIHYKAEGRHEYNVLLFVPSMRPFDLYDPSRAGSIRLYVRRVYITDEAHILPSWLRFVRGVIDSEDMPLNISREMLQNNPIVASIRKAVANRVLSEIGKCAENEPGKFSELWDAFGPVIKEGLYEDPERRDELFNVVRFKTTKGDGWRSLADYVSDFRPNQTAIYYLTGDSEEQLRASPQLEGFKARGLEVLLLCDPVDNFWVTTALGYDGKPFQSITQGEADLSNIPHLDEAKQPDAKAVAANAEMLGRLKTVLADAVSDVRISSRLVESPACLVAGVGGPDRGLNKLLERQAGAKPVLPILEINNGHALVKALDLATRGEKPAGKRMPGFEDLAWLLLDEARILDGLPPSDPAKFSDRINRLVLSGLA